MEIGSLGRWYDAGPILTANLGDTANPSWNDFKLVDDCWLPIINLVHQTKRLKPEN